MCDNENNYYKKDNGNDRSDCGCVPCEPLHPLAKPVILACGNGTPVEIEPDESDKQHNAGYVYVDTTCLCKPLVKIDFCANIFYRDEIGLTSRNKVILKFVLISVCDGIENVLNTFIYRREFDIEVSGELQTQDSFCFTYCDRPCPGCCIYKVIVKDDVGSNVNEISIRQTQINAIAQSQC